MLAEANLTFGKPAAATTSVGISIAECQPTVDTVKGRQEINIKCKSWEEIRMNDNSSNSQALQTGSTGFFGATAQPTATSTGLLGNTTQQETTGLFGQSATGTTKKKGLLKNCDFGQPATSAQPQNNFLSQPFGSTATSAFGATSTDASNPFGNKPVFGQTAQSTLFGQPQASTAPTFNTGFSGFGVPANTQQTFLFGGTTNDANKPNFGLGFAANTSFSGFGGRQTSTAGNTGPFGAKPNIGFGTQSAFGGTSMANNAGFSNFSLNKPAATGFGGFGAQTSTPSLNFNAGTANNSLFGNTAAKPGGYFGSNNTHGSNFGPTTHGCDLNRLSDLGASPQQSQQIHIQQPILSEETSPYDDNPSTQKEMLDSISKQFKLSAKSSLIYLEAFIGLKKENKTLKQETKTMSDLLSKKSQTDFQEANKSLESEIKEIKERQIATILKVENLTEKFSKMKEDIMEKLEALIKPKEQNDELVAYDLPLGTTLDDSKSMTAKKCKIEPEDNRDRDEQN